MVEIPDNIIKAVKKFKKRIENDLDIEKVILLGSFAKGLGNEKSDIDVCIIARDISNNYLALLKIAPKTIGIDTRIEPLVFSTDDFYEENSFGVLKEIKERGIEIN